MFKHVLKRAVKGAPQPAMEKARLPILIVDDEPGVLMVARRILERAGYTVLEARDGGEAMSLVRANVRLEMLVSDVNMPGLTGDEVARQLRTHQPDLKCLFLSGYVDQLFDKRPHLWEGEAFLEKPFTPKALLEAVSLLLYERLDAIRA
jgi:two-component system cell cycle sensor histidine kinase/response regulator CckA